MANQLDDLIASTKGKLKTLTMKTIFENLINDNLLLDAKKSAKRFTSDALISYAHLDLNWNIQVAIAAVNYLKGKISFQEYCDITAKDSE